jgi:predicted  nucleic acid-binding Zn-ribbon protein
VTGARAAEPVEAVSTSQRVEVGGDVLAPIINGSHNLVTVYRGGRPAFGLARLTLPPEVPAGAGPAALLAARHEVVPYVGREEFRRRCREWLASEPACAARLVTAPGGQGKTRLALQVARDAATEGWRVILARHQGDGGLLGEAAAEVVPAAAQPVGTLVVVDYADRWPREDLQDLLTRHPPTAGAGPARVLLLGRSSAFWFPFTTLLDSAGIAVSHEPLPDLASPVAEGAASARRLMFDTAVTAFVEQMCGTGRSSESVVDAVVQPDLSREGFALTLAVHMAALVAVLATVDPLPDVEPASTPLGARPTAPDPAALSRNLLLREVWHWQRMMQRPVDPLRLSTTQMARAVLVATLIRGLPPAVARPLLAGLPLDADNAAVLDGHALCYPPQDATVVLAPLYPDRLGEDFIATVLPGAATDQHIPTSISFLTDHIAPDILTGLLAYAPDPVTTRTIRRAVLTMLTETARRWDHVATHHLIPALNSDPTLVLAAGGTTIARLAPLSTFRPHLPTLGALLNTTIGAGSHLDLGIGAVTVSELLLDQARTNGDTATLASTLTTHAIRLGAVGRRTEALTAAQEAVTLRRELANLNRNTHLPNLATSVNNLANHLSEAGRRTEALTAAQEAVTLYRELANLNRNTYLPDLAMSVINLANYLAAAGRRADGLTAAQKAVTLYRELANLNRDAHLPNLAASVNNLAVRLAEAGRRAEALTTTQEAVTLRRELVALNRDAYLPNLAASVTNLAVDLGEAGRRAEALTTAQEAVTLYRELVALNRDAYLPNLATSVNNLANHLAAVERRAEALTTAQEAVTLRRKLVGLNRDAYLPDLATSVNNLAIRLAAAERRAEALTTAQEAVGYWRELAERWPDSFADRLAQSERVEAWLRTAE